MCGSDILAMTITAAIAFDSRSSGERETKEEREREREREQAKKEDDSRVDGGKKERCINGKKASLFFLSFFSVLSFLDLYTFLWC